MSIDFFMRISNDDRTFNELKIREKPYTQKDYKIVDEDNNQIGVIESESLTNEDIKENNYKLKKRRNKKDFEKLKVEDKGIVLVKLKTPVNSPKYVVAYVEVVSALTIENTERKEFKYIVIKYTYDESVIKDVKDYSKTTQRRGTLFMDKDLLNKFNEKLDPYNWS